MDKKTLAKYLADYFEHDTNEPIDKITIGHALDAFESTENCKLVFNDGVLLPEEENGLSGSNFDNSNESAE